MWVGFAISTLCFVARIATRLRIFRRLGLDDFLLFLAWLSSLIWSVVWHVFSERTYLNIKVQVHELPMDMTTYLANSYYYIAVQIAAVVCQTFGVWCVKYAFLAFFWKLGPRDGVHCQTVVWRFAMIYTTVAFLITLAVPPWRCLTGIHDLGGTLSKLK